MEQVRGGFISIEEAGRVPQNILTRSLGSQAEVQIDVEEHPLFPGDILLLCSDGLGKELTEAEVLHTVLETEDPQELVTRLIHLANEAGGEDNVTVAVARVEKAGLGQSLKGFFKSISGP
jgi:serine/threonine protein phosphatase PrpC